MQFRQPLSAAAAAGLSWTTIDVGDLTLLDLGTPVVDSRSGASLALVNGRASTGNYGAVLYAPAITWDMDTHDLITRLIYTSATEPNVTAGVCYLGCGVTNGGANIGLQDEALVGGYSLEDSGTRAAMTWAAGRGASVAANLAGTTHKEVTFQIGARSSGDNIGRYLLTTEPRSVSDPVGEDTRMTRMGDCHPCIMVGLTGTLANAAQFDGLTLSWALVPRAPE